MMTPYQLVTPWLIIAARGRVARNPEISAYCRPLLPSYGIKGTNSTPHRSRFRKLNTSYDRKAFLPFAARGILFAIVTIRPGKR
jgi:hypothetical protein